MKLPESLQGDSWTATTARRILPLLVAYAESYSPVTYGQLSKEVQRRRWGRYVMPLAFRTVAGAIGDAIQETEEEWDRTIPPINALIVNADTGLPGHSVDYYLRHYVNERKGLPRLTESQRESIV